VIAVVVAILGLAVSALISHAPSTGLFAGPTVALMSIGGALVLFNLVVLRTRQGLGDSRIFRDSWFLQSIFFPVAGIPVALMTHEALPVVLCWYGALVVSTSYGILAKSALPIPSGPSITVRTREIVATSLAGHVGVVGQQFLFRGDVVVLAFFVSASSLGIYSVATPIAGLIWIFSEALSLLAFDSGHRVLTPDEQAARRRRLVKLNFVFGAIGAACIAVASLFLIPLVLPQYGGAIPLIIILLPGVLVQGYARITLSSILTTGDRKASILIGIGSAALSGLYVPFVLALSVTGAAVASTVIYILQTGVVAAVVRAHNRRLAANEGANGDRSAA
jgi:O-antigen/teichoic acid export membrane protein